MIGVLTSPALKQYFDKIIEKKVFKNLAELSYEVSQHNLVIFIRNRGI